MVRGIPSWHVCLVKPLFPSLSLSLSLSLSVSLSFLVGVGVASVSMVRSPFVHKLGSYTSL